LRVLHVLNNLDRGGAEIYTLRLAGQFLAQGHENYLAYTREGSLLECLEAVTDRACSIGSRALDFRSLWSNLAAVCRLVRLIRIVRPDVLHAHVFEAYVWACFAGMFTGVPLIRTVVATRRDAQAWSPPVERILARWTSRFVAFTGESREELASFGIDAHRIAVIPNGVDFGTLELVGGDRTRAARQELGAESRETIVGTVGRLHWHKNQEMFLRSAALVAGRTDDVRFVIDGEGPLRDRLVSVAEELGIADRVVFTGWSSDVYALISAFDVFVLSSVSEGTPNVVLEAMGLGVPVVATAVGGVPRALDHGHAGILVPSNDPEQMANEILILLADRARLRELGTAGMLHCRSTYDFSQISMQVSDLYRDVS
jgi:glycosyltransferase involved in cell wall biosynthesis